MTTLARLNISIPTQSENLDELGNLIVPFDEARASRCTGKNVITTVVRTVGYLFMVAWTGAFALAFLAAYGGIPLVFV